RVQRGDVAGGAFRTGRLADLGRRNELSGGCAGQHLLPESRRRAVRHSHDFHRRGGSREYSRPDRASNLSGRNVLFFRGPREPAAKCCLLGHGRRQALRQRIRREKMATAVQLKEQAMPAPSRPDLEELKSRVDAVRPQIEARAHATEKACRVPEENISALRAIGYFDIVKPALFGGYEHDFDVLVELNIELAKSCASTAWVAGLLAAHQWLIAGFPEQAQRDVWDESPDAVACGSYAPAAKATPADGGYRLSGRWSFASGCDNAQWSLCAALLPAATEGGPLTPAFLLVPASDYGIDDTWNVVGLAGTGSKTLVLTDVFVPEHRVLNFTETTSGQTPGAALYAANP